MLVGVILEGEIALAELLVGESRAETDHMDLLVPYWAGRLRATLGIVDLRDR
jgi:hypothetical protein